MSSIAAFDFDLVNQSTIKVQPIQNYHEFGLFYQPPNDDNFYHAIFKSILQHSENLEDDYDYEFFYGGYYVTCKLFPRSLIIDILNKEIYGIDFDVNNLKCKHALTLKQKINLEQSLIPFLQGKVLKRDFSSTSVDQFLTTQPNELGLFYQPQNDINIYNVNCKITLQDYHQNDDDNYDYEFFYEISNDMRHVTCKFLPPSLVISILNKKIYGIDFDVNDLKRKHKLTLQQKLNLEQNLKKLFLYNPEREMRSDSDGNSTISFQGSIESSTTNGSDN
ncbi:hypothetical protein RhiirA5_373992 [Rhizophagus irregularis]|uniref:Uncharacterized protein n=1 Tax=Rhizophagus irregularis TaxID=588596 RepID=A0A2N0PWT5_9GLOM|nr:hypothetical protein RhiirA5_373992 [Rhizophagus irregularis]CAB5203388.1 unnamed protein product [Rhizophagus irregularis]